jgi:iron complex outermembrane receptor protein
MKSIAGSTKRFIFGLIQLVALTALASGSYALDLDQTIDFNIPKQKLDSALVQFSEQAKIQITSSSDQVKDFSTDGIVCRYKVSMALKVLLQRSGLSYKPIGQSAISIGKYPADSEQSTTQNASSGSSDDASSNKEGKKNSSQDFRVAQGTLGPPAVGDDQDSEKKKKEEGLSEIVITGSHIRGIDNKTNPIIVIDRDQIDRSGYSSTQDLFRSLPQNFTSGDASEDGAFSGNANAGRNTDYASGVNLRGLGVSSTLVLLDGHRLAPSAFGSVVDISLIPLSAIDRVEVLTDGSSAIYGSDAVGGVVNIILKKDYRGADTTARFGSVTNGSRHEELLAQTLGTTWSGGNIVGTLQYQHQGALPASDRDFASALPSPNDLLPETRSYGATLNGRQTLADGLEFYGDVLLSKRNFNRSTSVFEGQPALGIIFGTHTDGAAQTVDITPGLSYKISDRWSVDVSGLYARQKTTDFQVSGVPSKPLTDYSDNNQFTEKSVDLIVNGRVAVLPAGDIGLAAGMSYRTEDLNAIDVQTPGDLVTPTLEHRHVAAAFAELYVPVVGREDQIPIVRALEISAAVRRDHYSDFGSTTNPRIGMHWEPWKDVSFRASYGKSFRAPNAVEEATGAPLFQTILSFPPVLASPAGGLTSALLLGGSKSLTAERTYAGFVNRI